MKKSLRLRIVKALIPCFSLLLITSVFTEINAQNVTGKVFRDFDANGQQTATNPIEPSVAGVTVTAFKADGTPAGTATTAADGTYSIAVGTGSQVRIEFSNFPSAYYSGPKGLGSGTSVQFVNGGGTANLGINYPSDYCGVANPKLVTPCYINGTPLNGGTSGNDDAIVSVPYTPTGNGSKLPAGTNPSENGYLAKGKDVGATWGMAYQRSSKFIFTSALLKRHSGFGNGGPGAIYKIDNSGANPVASLFVDLNSDLGVSAGTDPRKPLSAADSIPKIKTQPSRDSTAFGLVGKMSLGDLDISDDEKTLWVINTFDRKLYELPIGSPAVKPTTKIAHTLPNPGCTNGVFRPWAVKFWRGKVYVGGVCTAENAGGTAADLKAYIYSFTPGSANPDNFTEVYNFKLDYPRGYTSVDGFNTTSSKTTSAAWKPWIAQWSDITNPLPDKATYNQTICPQPMLSDIEFDVDGSMILGFMDRAGHQLGSNNYSTLVTDFSTADPTVRNVYEGTSAGDILRVGLNADKVTYSLENNATVNGVVSGGNGQSPSQGPGNGEFYWQDMYPLSSDKNRPNGSIPTGQTNPDGGHQEISLGGIALFPGKNEVVETVFDPVNAFRAGGVRWFDNTTGASPRGYEIFGQDAGGLGVTFGKANGLGDLELLCNVQPIEVGNRMWNDTNKNGIQDAGEPVLTGVTVELWKGNTKIDTKTTDGTTGEYFFTDLTPNSAYEIRIPNVNGVSKQTQLAGLQPTTDNVSANSKDNIDSDVSVTGSNTYAAIAFNTGNAGENLHSLDAGFSCLPPNAKPNGQNVAICDPTSTFTGLTAASASETWGVVTTPANPATATINPTTGAVAGMTVNGTYRFVLSNTQGCSDTVSIVRGSIPMAGADKTICSPATTSIVNASTTGQVWTVTNKPSGTNPVIAADGKVTGLTVDGVYLFTISQGNCSDVVEIRRLARPNAGADLSTCGTSIIIKDQGSDTWAVVANPANPASATIDSFGEVTGMTVAGTYQFALTSANGCSDTVKVVKNVAANVTATDVKTCIGGVANLKANSTTLGATYFWSGPVSFTSSQQNPSIANIANSNMGNYTVTVTSQDGCTASAVAKVSLLNISVSLIAGKTAYCVGEDIILRTFTPEAGYIYDWTGPNSFSSMNTLNIRIPTTPAKVQQGVYSMAITDPSGCSAVSTINITVSECLSIGNLVWNDTNNDGLNNNSEIGVGGAPVRLFKATLDGGGNPTDVPNGAAIASTTTSIVAGNVGKYLFSGLIPGYYIVEIDAPTGFKTSTGTNGSATGTYEPANSPNNDVNDNDDGTKITGQTIRSKAIELGNFTEPTGDGDLTTGTDADKNSNLTIDFGIFKAAQIGDLVWSDTNKDGIQQASETAGVPNVIIKLYDGTGTTLIATTTSDANGNYTFDNVIPGTYTVEFVKSSIGAGNNFSPKGAGTDPLKNSDADPVTGKSSPFTVTEGQTNLGINAGVIGECPGSTTGTITVPSLCVGQSVTLKAISSDPLATYSWSKSPAGFTATTQEVTIPNLTVANSGTYSVLITNSNACTSALTANVVVNPIPTVSATGIEICQGTTGKLTASGATTYAWTGANSFTATGSQVSVTQAGVYTVTGTSNGCTANATASVTVNLNPTLTATGAAICLGGSGTVSVLPAGLTYAWVGPNGFASTQQTASITNAIASNQGTYTVNVTNAKGCSSTATVSVTVGVALTVTPTSNSPVCQGSRLELTINGGTGAKYLWTSPSGVTSTMQTPFNNGATAIDSGVWTVAVENADGCKGVGSTTVVINPLPTNVTATASAPTCAGGNITLTATPAGAKSYEWSGTPTFSSTVQNPTLTSPVAGNYTFTVKVTNNEGCTAVATTATTIFATPTATASSNSPVCFGQSIQLGVTTNGTKFAWSGPSFTSTSQSPIIANATAAKAGVYTVVVTNANSCSVTATTTVTVNSQLNAGNDISICEPITTAQLPLIVGTNWISQSTNPIGVTINNATGLVSGLNSNGTYVFIVSNAGGCKDTVNVFRNPKLDAGNDKVICSPTSTAKLLATSTGQTWRYFANGSTAPAPTVSSAGNVSGMTQDGTYLFILEQTGTPTYCADTVGVIRKAAPNAGIDQTGASGICEPQTTAKLQAAGANQTWTVASNSTGAGTVAIDATGAITKMNTNGTYIFVLTQGDCSDSIRVERKARPNAGTDVEICEPETTAKVAVATTGFTWSAASGNPATALINASGNISGLTSNGVYNFVLTSVTGCTDTVKVTRNGKPNAGTDLVGNKGICEPATLANLTAATTGLEWKVGNKPAGTTPVINATTGAITGMTANGIYEFVLVNKTTLCADTIKVERSAKPSAGVDLSFCADSTKYKLPNAPANMVWTSVPSNPSSTQIGGATGEIIGMTVVGDYNFVLTNASGCTDTVKVSRKAIPAFDAKTVQATCTTGAANADGQLVVSGFDVANKYDFSEGTSYTGTKTFATATANSTIPASGVIANNLANPTVEKSYTVRMFNANGCYTDKTVKLIERACLCKPDVCLPYSFKKTK